MNKIQKSTGPNSVKKILILGVNGFIGHHLAARILNTTKWQVYGIDLYQNNLVTLLAYDRFHFLKADISVNRKLVEELVRNCDIIIPLAAIATPASYISDPIKVFELDFEENLKIVRSVVHNKKRLIFPSTSEVYGMSPDDIFDPDRTNSIYGPISKTRWIYACSKQLMDRIIHAYGLQEQLCFTLFRPFNWVGSGQDSVDIKDNGSSRVVSQFTGHIIRGETLYLTEGGHQKRCFTDIRDGIDALMFILNDNDGISNRKIYNIGNPDNELSIRDLALKMISIAGRFFNLIISEKKVKIVNIESERYYGDGYQDIMRRVPSISLMMDDFGWSPQIGIDESIIKIFTDIISRKNSF